MQVNITCFIDIENALKLIFTRIPNIKISKQIFGKFQWTYVYFLIYIYKKFLAQMVMKYMVAPRRVPINSPGNYPCLHSSNKDLMKFTLWNLFLTSLTLKSKIHKTANTHRQNRIFQGGLSPAWRLYGEQLLWSSSYHKEVNILKKTKDMLLPKQNSIKKEMAWIFIRHQPPPHNTQQGGLTKRVCFFPIFFLYPSP